MSDLLVRGSEGEGPALRVRGVAYTAMTEVLRLQASARPHSMLGWLAGVSPLTPDARQWYRGALGELRLATALRELPAPWTLLCSADPEAGQLLIGPAGVFSIHIRDHVGQRITVTEQALLVNGHRTNHLANARYEADRASRLLRSGVGERIDVTPVIAVVDPGFLSTVPSDVLVVASSQLVRTLLRTSGADASAPALVAAATASGQWHPAARVLDESQRHEAGFTRVRDAVDAAARRKWAWVVGCAGLSVAALLALAF